MRLLRAPTIDGPVCWVNRDLAFGCPEGADGWRMVRANGVRGVVDVSEEPSDIGPVVRRHRMRYLRLSVLERDMPEAEELHIVTSWVQQRIQDGGPVLIHEARGRGNDALIACAVLVKQGTSVKKAQAQLRGVSNARLTQSQVDLLHQFSAQQVVAANGG